MKLQHITISGFRSIKEKETLLVDAGTTVLIGANDHGKTNILEAIQRINDDSPLTEDDRNWDMQPTDQPWLEWTFALGADDAATFQAAFNTFTETNAVPAEEDTFIPTNGEEHVVFSREGVGSPVTVKSLPFQTPLSFAPSVLAMRPRVELFLPPATNLQDSISLAELQTDFVMQGIFRLAGLWDERETIFAKSPITSKRIDQASKRLTTALNESWNQGKDLEWILKHNGARIEIEIGDPSISTRYSRPSVRSSGFRTYFLLSMITSAKTAGNSDQEYLFLFDEPGTYLHPHAQIDLQRSFERIAERTQIIYTTHSLFLINKNHPGRNKVVSKTAQGTKIDQKPFRRNWKSVRDSLGILFSSNFLIAEKTLLVEGPSDIIYILNAVKQLKAAGKIDLDLNDFSIVDAGTSENYIAMAKLMLSEGRTVVAVLDGDKSGNQASEKLKKTCEKELKEKALVLLPLPAGASTEDLFVNIEILRQAARQVADELVSQKIRAFADAALDWGAELKSIEASHDATLGYVFDQVTENWFEPKEKLSKLSVALRYEDLAKDKQITVDARAQQYIEKLKAHLQIRGEASAEEGVYDEV